jgi:hypothetical protein
MNNIKEITKVELQNGLWCVMVLSPVIGVGFICQGEWSTEEEANKDLRNWR